MTSIECPFVSLPDAGCCVLPKLMVANAARLLVSLDIRRRAGEAVGEEEAAFDILGAPNNTGARESNGKSKSILSL